MCADSGKGGHKRGRLVPIIELILGKRVTTRAITLSSASGFIFEKKVTLTRVNNNKTRLKPSLIKTL